MVLMETRSQGGSPIRGRLRLREGQKIGELARGVLLRFLVNVCE